MVAALKIQNILILLLLIVLWPAAVSAQPMVHPHLQSAAARASPGAPVSPHAPQMPAGPKFTLEQAVDAMRRGHLLIQATKADARAAAAEVVGAGLWSNPVLDGGYATGFAGKAYDALGFVSVGVTQFLESAGAPAA